MTWIKKKLTRLSKIVSQRLRALKASFHIYKKLTQGEGIDPRFITSCDIGLDIQDLKKRGIDFHHPVGIVISRHAKIGDNTLIWQNVTIGAKSLDNLTYPTIGRNVRIYAGAVIIGQIVIGDNCVIGANSVVTQSFPDNSVLAGIPAKRIGTVRSDGTILREVQITQSDTHKNQQAEPFM